MLENGHKVVVKFEDKLQVTNQPYLTKKAKKVKR